MTQTVIDQSSKDTLVDQSLKRTDIHRTLNKKTTLTRNNNIYQ